MYCTVCLPVWTGVGEMGWDGMGSRMMGRVYDREWIDGDGVGVVDRIGLIN